METENTEKKAGGSRALTFILMLLVLALVGTSYYFYSQFNALKANPIVVAQQEQTQVLEAVGKLILLPTDEQPTLAKVVDPEALKSQEFFANAAKDDEVLIYYQAKKAILYRPSINKIIQVAPIVIGNQNAQ